ncbi:prepilin peptidase [Amycolatopsis aidingensis]|uniref:prepilin peptidase n=1 Tax=Amycolatopsis aidingensis TaxID=2842453 RepID=UPI001E563BCD|nr:A24 family peptidase [Amycolatopsis aidingensis]
MELVLTLFLAVAGAGAGLTGRWLLGRARPPAAVPAASCALGTALLTAVVAARWWGQAWPGWWLPVPLVLTGFGVPLALADLAHRRLPNVLTLPLYPAVGLALGIAAVAAPGTAPVTGALLGALVFGGAHLLVHLAAPAALGAGDVKLAGSLGAVLGVGGWAVLVLAACLAAVAAAMATVVAAVVARLRRAGARRHGVPHGPGLLAATWLVAVFPGTGWEVAYG